MAPIVKLIGPKSVYVDKMHGSIWVGELQSSSYKQVWMAVFFLIAVTDQNCKAKHIKNKQDTILQLVVGSSVDHQRLPNFIAKFIYIQRD